MCVTAGPECVRRVCAAVRMRVIRFDVAVACLNSPGVASDAHVVHKTSDCAHGFLLRFVASARSVLQPARFSALLRMIC